MKYHEELRIRHNYLSTIEPPFACGYDPVTQEDVATKAVLREYFQDLAREDALVASLMEKEEGE